MRILTSICCTAVLLPLASLAAQANSVEDQTVNPKEASFFVKKSDFLDQQQWTTQAENLKTLVAQTETSTTEKNIADNSWTKSDSIDTEKAQEVIFDLQNISNTDFAANRGAPSFTVANPYGFGADGGKFFTGLTYQPDVRFDGDSSQGDALMGFGVGLGNAKKAVGVELNYTMASFGTNRDFGTGGFNAKIHRQFPDNWAVAAGWNGFLNIGDQNDFGDSIYFVTTKIFRTRESLNSPFSRVAATIGVGNGQFNNEGFNSGDDTFNVFGSLAFRIAKPVSGIVEWTGSDLALGLSASPFKNVPATFNIALRDLAGEGDGARVIFGVGMGF